MLDEARRRTTVLMGRMADEGIHTAVFTDESSIAYIAGFWGYLGIEFGRPTMLVLSTIHDPVVITPLMESEMAAEMTWVDDIRVWEDAGQRGWGRVLSEVLPHSMDALWIERDRIPSFVRDYLEEKYPGVALKDIGPVFGAQRMIKSPFEIEVMRKAGRIAGDWRGEGPCSCRRPRRSARSPPPRASWRHCACRRGSWRRPVLS